MTTTKEKDVNDHDDDDCEMTPEQFGEFVASLPTLPPELEAKLKSGEIPSYPLGQALKDADAILGPNWTYSPGCVRDLNREIDLNAEIDLGAEQDLTGH